ILSTQRLLAGDDISPVPRCAGQLAHRLRRRHQPIQRAALVLPWGASWRAASLDAGRSHRALQDIPSRQARSLAGALSLVLGGDADPRALPPPSQAPSLPRAEPGPLGNSRRDRRRGNREGYVPRLTMVSPPHLRHVGL